MAGLLYKDFIAVKGKLYIWGSLFVMLLIFVLRIIAPPSEMDVLIMALWMCSIMMLYFFIVGKLEVSLVAADEGRRQKQYYVSLPISKKQYVASKYIFILLAFYIVLSIGTFTGTICRINCQDKTIDNMVNQFMGLLPLITYSFLLIPTIEMPFFIGLGAKKGGHVKTGIFIGLFFVCIVYLLFGDLSIGDKISLPAILKYCEEHQGILLTLQVLSPYITLGLYYLSYRISSWLFARKEWEDD